ncbi:hypothetical protein HDU87_005715 [Geranomyces variabilis]|uniref:Uncharacterized protein n=1 Tax=Geranomyces variabilis TaxID=109894 RepID=A0AAD5TGU1_9FUNG|nr:hypothetical protein HDU87_005715 [Geranomyces variabilis]
MLLFCFRLQRDSEVLTNYVNGRLSDGWLRGNVRRVPVWFYDGLEVRPTIEMCRQILRGKRLTLGEYEFRSAEPDQNLDNSELTFYDLSGYMSTVGKYMLQHGAMLGFFLSIGSLLRSDDETRSDPFPRPTSYTPWGARRSRLPIIIEPRTFRIET